MDRVKRLNIAIKKTVKNERARLIKNKMKNSSSSTFWKTMNDLLGRSGAKETIQIADDEGTVLTKEEMADTFGEFFVNKVEGLAAKNPVKDPPCEIEFSPIKPFDLSSPRNHQDLMTSLYWC
jgi:hypothetical protein